MPMSILLYSLIGEETGIYFTDSTTLKGCHNKRVRNHTVFKGLAYRGKSTIGCFFGLKLRLIINYKRDIIAVKINPGSTDDRKTPEEIVNGLQRKGSMQTRGLLVRIFFKNSGKKEYLSVQEFSKI